MKKVLIIGVSGQDGSLLAKFLLNLGSMEIFGTSRDLHNCEVALNKLGINKSIILFQLDPINFIEVESLINKIRPTFIFNLSGQTSVGKSFSLPLETYQSNILTTINILESINKIDKSIRFLNSASTECFGQTDFPANEMTLFNPISPYAVAKTATINITKNYRDVFGIFACSAILSNHESTFRPENFISKKIVESVLKISKGDQSTLEIGNIDIIRDWGWAEEYVEALYLILNHDKPEDFIIATGKSISLEEFISYSFSKLGLNYMKYIRIEESLIRKNEHNKSLLDPSKAEGLLNWKAKFDAYSVIDKLFVQSEILNEN